MTNSKRLNRVDEIRGFTLISMILYHFMWDLKYIATFNIEWYTGPIGKIWQKSICICFIFISGFCFSFGKNRIRRSGLVFLCGAIVSAVTLILMPENRIVFGILTFIGTAGLITILVDKFHSILERKLNERTINLTMVIVMLLLFIAFFNVNAGYLYFPLKTMLPNYLYKGYIETFIGFPDPTFYSTDYFSLLPWLFLYLMGYYTQRIVTKSTKAVEFLKEDIVKVISFLGRKTLIIYMIHQPVLYLLTLVVMKIR